MKQREKEASIKIKTFPHQFYKKLLFFGNCVYKAIINLLEGWFKNIAVTSDILQRVDWWSLEMSKESILKRKNDCNHVKNTDYNTIGPLIGDRVMGIAVIF